MEHISAGMNSKTNKKISILYIAFIDFNGSYKSGSEVRPVRMLEAFNNLGYDLTVLDGASDKKSVKKRKQNVKAIIRWLEDHDVDICYVEPPSGPFFCKLDLKLLKILKSKNVPIGLFYRDAYWKFPDFECVTGVLGRIKSSIITCMQKRDWRVFEDTCKCIYFPSEMLASYFVEKPKWILPPGCKIEDASVAKSADEMKRGIYVGGATEQYGIYLLLDSFQKINEKETKVLLSCVCPEGQWNALPSKYKDYEKSSWLEVLHLSSGEKLDQVYKRVDFAIIPRLKSVYTDLSMPVKLFEYLSKCKPIISTNCVESAKFIETNEIGIVVEDHIDSLVDGINMMINDKDLYYKLVDNCKQAREENTWEKRVIKIVDDLVGR